MQLDKYLWKFYKYLFIYILGFLTCADIIDFNRSNKHKTVPPQTEIKQEAKKQISGDTLDEYDDSIGRKVLTINRTTHKYYIADSLAAIKSLIGILKYYTDKHPVLLYTDTHDTIPIYLHDTIYCTHGDNNYSKPVNK